MKAEDNKSILIDSLVEQFSGNAFASLIVEHYKKLNLEDTVSSMLGIMKEIPIDEKELESWVDSINSIASDYGEGFWSEDCGKIYKLIAAKAKIYLINHSIPIIDNNIFNLCQLVIVNFSYGMHVEPKMKALIEGVSNKSKGVKGWPMLLFFLGFGVFIFYPLVGIAMIICSLWAGSVKRRKLSEGEIGSGV